VLKIISNNIHQNLLTLQNRLIMESIKEQYGLMTDTMGNMYSKVKIVQLNINGIYIMENF